MKKVLVVGSISQSPFIANDVQLLSTLYKVDTIDIIGILSKNKFHVIIQFIDLAKMLLCKLLPKVIQNDVVFVWFADVHAFFALIFAKIFRKKIIISIGGYEVCDMPEINYGLQRSSIRGWMSRVAMRYADNCIIPSQSYFARSIPYVNVNRLCLLSTCTIVNYPIEVEKDNIVVMVGSATEDSYKLKGIPLFDDLASKSSTTFCLAGRYDEHIKNKYRHIYYLGQMSHNEVISLMNRSKIYCQLSITESFGVSILEAMSVGCIPVVLNIDNLKNLIDDNIIFCCSNDVNEIEESINKFLSIKTSDYRKKIISSARLQINDIYAKRKEGFEKLIGV